MMTLIFTACVGKGDLVEVKDGVFVGCEGTVDHVDHDEPFDPKCTVGNTVCPDIVFVVPTIIERCSNLKGITNQESKYHRSIFSDKR